MIIGRIQIMPNILSCDWLHCFQYNLHEPQSQKVSVHKESLKHEKQKFWDTGLGLELKQLKGNTQTKAKGGLASLMVCLEIGNQ